MYKANIFSSYKIRQGVFVTNFWLSDFPFVFLILTSESNLQPLWLFDNSEEINVKQTHVFLSVIQTFDPIKITEPWMYFVMQCVRNYNEMWLDIIPYKWQFFTTLTLLYNALDAWSNIILTLFNTKL